MKHDLENKEEQPQPSKKAKRVYGNDEHTSEDNKYVLADADYDDVATFHEWQRQLGLDLKEWDESRNGPIAHRCLDSVYFVLFQSGYKRPANWNDPSKYFKITLLNGDGGDGSDYHYVRCDQLQASQFDHLITVGIYNNGELGMAARVYMWFHENDGDCGGEELDEEGLSEYGYSHMKENATFCKDAYDENGVPIVLLNRLERPLVPECEFNIAFAASLYISGW